MSGTEPFVVGVDLGGTKVEACLLDSDRHILERVRIPSEAEMGLDRVIGNICRVIDKAAAGRPFAAVGMGTPATYLEKEDRLFGAPHTPVYESPGFIQRIRDSLPVPLLVENDANCLALAEFFAVPAGIFSLRFGRHSGNRDGIRSHPGEQTLPGFFRRRRGDRAYESEC